MDRLALRLSRRCSAWRATRALCATPTAAPGISSIEDSVFKKLVELNVQPNTNILLSVSGGSDSMAMLHIMQRVSARALPLNLKIVNFNHLQREESLEEAAFVRECGNQLGLEVVVDTVPDTVAQASVGFQEIARDYRRSALLCIAESSFGGSKQALICQAHHQDDQMETLLLKLLRGVHITKISAMSALSGPFLRPLLHLSKEQLRGYLTAQGLHWREDASNQMRKYKRNKVRLDLIPLMEELSGGQEAFQQRMLSLSAQSQQMKEVLLFAGQQARAGLTFRRFPYDSMAYMPSLLAAPDAVIADILNDWIVRVTSQPTDHQRLAQIVSMMRNPVPGSGRIVCLPGYWQMLLVGQELRLQPRQADEPEPAVSQLQLNGQQVTVVHPNHVAVTAAVGGCCGDPASQSRCYVVPLSLADDEQRLHVRCHRNEDIFHTSANHNGVVVNKFLRQRKVPLHERSRVLVVTTADDAVRAVLLAPDLVCVDGRCENANTCIVVQEQIR